MEKCTGITGFFLINNDRDGSILNALILSGFFKQITDAMHGDFSSLNEFSATCSRFVFMNLECNAHLQRDLQKIGDETGHKVLLEIKELITATIRDRNERIQEKKKGFGEVYIENFNQKLTELLEKAGGEAASNESIYSGSFECSLIARIKNYRGNFFVWVEDFSLPTTNNLSERALRGVKTKMKVSGQFASAGTADNYAAIRTYIETCRRNGINEMEALKRLCRGRPLYRRRNISSSIPAIKA